MFQSINQVELKVWKFQTRLCWLDKELFLEIFEGEETEEMNSWRSQPTYFSIVKSIG